MLSICHQDPYEYSCYFSQYFILSAGAHLQSPLLNVSHCLSISTGFLHAFPLHSRPVFHSLLHVRCPVDISFLEILPSVPGKVTCLLLWICGSVDPSSRTQPPQPPWPIAPSVSPMRSRPRPHLVPHPSAQGRA